MAPTVLFSVLLAGCVFSISLAGGLESLKGGARALKDVLGGTLVAGGGGKLRPRSPSLNTPMERLTEVYDLENARAPWGPYKIGVTFGGQSCQAPIASVYLMVHDEDCWMWDVFYRGRLLMWHQGKTVIHMIHTEGTSERMCLGDTLEDQRCKYVVHVPAGTKMFPMPEEHTITTGIILGGLGLDGKSLTFEEMESEYSDTTMSEVIQHTKRCFMASN